MSWIPLRPQVNLPILKRLLLKGNSPSCICMSKGLLHAIKFAGHFSVTAKLEMPVQRRCIDQILQKNGKTQKNVRVSSDHFCIYFVSVCKRGRGKSANGWHVFNKPGSSPVTAGMFFSNPCCSPCRCPFPDLTLLWVSQRWCWGATLEGWQGGSIGSEKGWNNFSFPVILQSWGYSYFPAVNWWWKLNDCASYWGKSCGGNHCSARKIFACMSVVQNPLLHHFWRKQAMKSYSIVQTPTCTPLWGCRTCFHLLCFQQGAI